MAVRREPSTALPSATATKASSNVSLATRLALLELLTLGSVPSPASALSLSQSHVEPAAAAAAGSEKPSLAVQATLAAPNTSLVARSQDAHARMHDSIQRYKPVVQFVEQYRVNQPYLLPQLSAASSAAALQATTDGLDASSSPTASSPAQQSVTPQSVIALLFDAESDLRQLDRDLRACDTYARRDVAGAGDLAQHEQLRPRLATIKTQLAQTLTREQQTEQTALALMQRCQTHTDTVSQLFIHWDTMLTTVEETLGRLERQRA